MLASGRLDRRLGLHTNVRRRVTYQTYPYYFSRGLITAHVIEGFVHDIAAQMLICLVHMFSSNAEQVAEDDVCSTKAWNDPLWYIHSYS